MATRTLSMTDQLYEYYLSISLREPEVLTELRKETQKLSSHQMQIAPEQGQFMAFLIELISARKTLDIGVYTGYSALVVAMALPENGRVIACDTNVEWTKIAQKYWMRSGQHNKIELRIAPADETLQKLLEEGEQGSFDFIFIDADKKNYDIYYELSLKLLRPGGIIAIDNVLWEGQVADPSQNDPNTEAIRALNQKIVHDNRVSLSMLPIADGLTLVRKRI
jgi:predicted O-methyltransferase YrrM